MAYEMVMPYHLHMPSYFLETFTEYPFIHEDKGRWQDIICFYSIKLGKTFSVLNFLGDIPVIRLKKRVNEDGVEKFSL